MMRFITHLGGATFSILVSVVLIVAGQTALGLATLLANALSHLAVQGLKRTVVRRRPADAHGNLVALIAVPDPYSFPSGHASAAFAVATSIVLQRPSLTLPLMALATLVAASRVTLKVHHLSDVLVGAALGVSAAISIHLMG